MSESKFCGVAVVLGNEYPCLLQDQHEGFCDFGLGLDQLTKAEWLSNSIEFWPRTPNESDAARA